MSFLLHCALSLAAQCIVIGPVCVCVVCVGLLPCIDLHQTGSVGEGSDHLQLIKFWPSGTPGKGVIWSLSAFFHFLCFPLAHSQTLTQNTFTDADAPFQVHSTVSCMDLYVLP